MTLFLFFTLMIPVALFVCVFSTTQNYDRQVADLMAVAKRQNWRVAYIIHEKGSATKKRNIKRPELVELVTLCRPQKIQKVLVTEYTRLGRQRGETHILIDNLTELSITVYAHNVGVETLLPDGRRNPAAEMVKAVMIEMGASEVERNSDRIKSGQAQTVSQGKHIGRPEGTTKTDQDIIDVVKDLKLGLSIRQVAAIGSVAKGTVEKVKAVESTVD